MSEYRFSVIIPSYNRADEVVDLIQSLQAQTFGHARFEVLIVDDGSTDDTEGKVGELSAQVDFRLCFFRRDHEGPGPARNYGMSQAQGAYFLFIDSDCLADAEWLKEINSAITNEDPDAFGGPDSVLANFSPFQKAIDYSMTSFLTTGGMRGHSKKRLAKFYPRSFNMGIRREIYNKLGGMSNLRHGQDIEFSRRIVSSGAKVIYIPNAIVYHKRRANLRKFFRQMFNWGVARINLTKLDRGNLEPLHFVPSLAVWGYLFLIILSPIHHIIFCTWLFVTAIMLGVLLIIFGSALGRYHDVKAALLAPIVSMTQVLAYGLGFSINYISRMILGRGEFIGFVKKYYH